MKGIGLGVATACALCLTTVLAQNTPSVTDPAEKAVAPEAPPPPADAAPKPSMPDVPKEALQTPAPMPEVKAPVEPVPAPISPFVAIFGDAVKLDPAMVKKVLSEEPGKRHYVDTNQDGKPEEVWFIDNAPRHPIEWQPLLVRAIDEDGDLENGGQPDQDSDLYVADWHADGTVDAVVDYVDVDHDQDLDEMAIYTLGTAAFGGEGSVVAWWSEDVGDDNLLWYEVGYTYDRAKCQYHCHFGGDERFCCFILPPGGNAWQTGVENPFSFHDLDGDGITEEAIRFESDGTVLKTMRDSLDADNDATADNPRDYDVSITAIAPASGIPVQPADTQQVQLRGTAVGPVLTFAREQTIGAPAVWDRMLFTWDEDDNNVDGETFEDTHERWEGVIPQGTDDFPQVGGPSCGPVNKRYELAIGTGAPSKCYVSPVDQRIHLYGATRAWMDIDADQDHKADMKYTYADTNKDGVIDTWSLDANADGIVDDTWTAKDAAVSEVAWSWPTVNAAQKQILATAPGALFALTQRLEQALKAAGSDPNADPVSQLLRGNFTAPAITPHLQRKFINSDESMRFYLDLLKDRLIIQLKGAAKDGAYWAAFNEARSRGDLAAMQQQLEQAYSLAEPLTAYADWIAAKRKEVNAGPHVAFAQDWVSDNVGWENDRIAYRAYWGQLDFYGKSHRGFILGNLKGDEQTGEWGLDALYVRDTAGLGGVTLYVNGQAYPVWSPQGKGFVTFENTLVEQADDRVVVDLKGSKVGPADNPYTVRLRCTLLAGRLDTGVEVLVDGGKPDDKIELGLNLTHLTEQPFYTLDQAAGIMAVRGYQTSNVGTIGLGLIFPPGRFLRVGSAPSENQVVVSIERGQPLTYHVQGDWVHGRRFPVAPSDADWMNELRTLAASLALK